MLYKTCMRHCTQYTQVYCACSGHAVRTCSLSPDMLYEVAGRETLTSTSEDGLSYSLYTRTYCWSIPLTDSGALQLTCTTSSDTCEVLTAEKGPGTRGEMHKKKSMPAWTEYGPAKRLYVRPCHRCDAVTHSPPVLWR